ncbi:MAG TPA: histidine phosphatase family protein [Polyangiaceae bacterium]|jgi:broad specificity phosphatase PhoE|nr:histidine phosphatase family protein [Polyangiaceae bacterium]
MLTLHLVRHGDTIQAAEGIFSGDLDPPLTELGHRQAERLAEATQSLGLHALYCSPKTRTRMTAQPIARLCGLSPLVEDGLREIAYGSWEGRREADVRKEDPEAFEAWRADPALVAPPGGESAFAIAARALPVLVKARHEHPMGHVMLVSHKATIRVIVCALLGMPLGRFRSHVACPTASITSFEFGERGPMLVRIGDVHHLSGL